MAQPFQKIAVLGSGVMGAQIAACFNQPVLLFDLKSDDTDPNQRIYQAINHLNQLKPAPLFDEQNSRMLIAKNFTDDFAALQECDLIIEAITEDINIKRQLYSKVMPHLNDHVIFTSNTSGLGINTLAQEFPAKLRTRFCGMHFFNPPRYMHLVELIPNEVTNQEVLDQLETYLTSYLGKGVLRAKDTPNFIANRIGVFAMLAIFYHADRLQIPFEVVDALTGPLLGRPKSATYRTADVVGLDTFMHVIQTMQDHLPSDPWVKYFYPPKWLSDLVAEGALGQKTKKGIYYKDGKVFYVYDPNKKDYRLADQKADEKVIAILKNKNSAEKFIQLRESSHPQAEFLWASLRDTFHYCAVHCQSIAQTVRDIDLAMRWGFGWRQGPFETWQTSDWQSIYKMIQNDIEQSKTMSLTQFPNWVGEDSRDRVYSKAGAYAPASGTYEPSSSLPVYQKQYFPQPVLAQQYDEGETLWESSAVRLWQLHPKIAILSFKTKMNCVSNAVLDGIIQAVTYAEAHCSALIIWQRHGDHFSVGADLREFAQVVADNDRNALMSQIDKFQQATRILRFCKIPTIAAVRGYVFGGGCELMLHCDRIVAAMETYLGLVEIGVGLLPAGGGCTEFTRRAFNRCYSQDLLASLSPYYWQIAKAEVAGNALMAKHMHFLRSEDTICRHSEEILYTAHLVAHELSNTAYLPPLPQSIRVCGRDGVATLQTTLVNYQKGGFISEYDFYLASQIAAVMCGGGIESGLIVDEAWLLQLEREHFVEMAFNEKTQDRIKHMLKNGKPLRN